MPSLVQVVSATSAGVGAERTRVGAAQLVVELAPALEVREGASVGGLALQLLRRGPHGDGGQRTVGARVEICARLQHGKLGAQPKDVHKPREYPHGQRTRADAAVAADAGRSRARGDDALHALGRRAPRARLRRLRRSVALVGGRGRGLLGEHLGVLRGAQLEDATSVRWPSARCPARAGSRAPS